MIRVSSHTRFRLPYSINSVIFSPNETRVVIKTDQISVYHRIDTGSDSFTSTRLELRRRRQNIQFSRISSCALEEYVTRSSKTAEYSRNRMSVRTNIDTTRTRRPSVLPLRIPVAHVSATHDTLRSFVKSEGLSSQYYSSSSSVIILISCAQVS